VRGESNLDPDRPIYLHRRHYDGSPVGPEKLWAKGEKYGIRVGHWKYIEGMDEGTRELFDLQEDPGERHNRVREEPEKAAELSARIAAWRESLGRNRTRGTLSEEDRRGLEALGYVE
jgi:arylsulfatase A-like enzyme